MDSFTIHVQSPLTLFFHFMFLNSDMWRQIVLHRFHALMAQSPPPPLPQPPLLEPIEFCPDWSKETKQEIIEAAHVLVEARQRKKRIRSENYACPFANCSKAFSSEYGLHRHKTSHEGKRPYWCPEKGCNKHYSRRSTLMDHASKIHLLPRTDPKLFNVRQRQ